MKVKLVNTLEEEKISPEIISLLQSDSDGISFMIHRNVLLGGIQCDGSAHVFGSNLTLPCSISELAEWLSSQKTYIESGSFAGRNAMLNWLNKMMRKKPLANLLKKAETARKVAQSNKREFLEWLEKGKTETPTEGTPAYFEQQVGSILGYYSIPEDWPHWAGKPTLVADEAIPLMNGLDPGSWRNRDKRMPPEQPLPDDMVREITRGLQIAEAGGLKAKSPTEWLAWGRSHGLDKPTIKSDQRLREPDICMWPLFAQAVAEVERKAQKEVEHIRRLSQDCIALSQLPVDLNYWLIHDNWTQEEGLILLLGLDPRGTKVSPSIFFNNAYPDGLEEFECAQFFNGKYIYSELDMDGLRKYGTTHDINNPDNTTQEVKILMWQLSNCYQDMNKIWVSGNYPALNTPEFFVEWAVSKGFNIPPELVVLAKDATQVASTAKEEAKRKVQYGEKECDLSIPLPPAPSDGDNNSGNFAQYVNWFKPVKVEGLAAIFKVKKDSETTDESNGKKTKIYGTENLDWWQERISVAYRIPLLKTARIKRAYYNPAKIADYLCDEGKLSNAQCRRILLKHVEDKYKDDANIVWGENLT